MVAQHKPRREWSRPQVIRSLGGLDLMDRSASCIPLYLKPAADDSLFGEHETPDLRVAGKDLRLNLSDLARNYLKRLGIPIEEGEVLFNHALAVLHAPAYAADNVGGLRQNWPRVPLPSNKDVLNASAELGRKASALLDTERAVDRVTAGTLRPELRVIAAVSVEGSGVLDPSSGDLSVTVGWGHRGQAGAVMPGRGKAAKREYTAEERTAIEQGAEALSLSAVEAFARLGDTTFDVYLNGRALWKNVPSEVWHYNIGGYQAIKKWLSYRERKVLGRDLTVEEVRYARDVVRRIAALLLLGEQLDENYQAINADPYLWERDSG